MICRQCGFAEAAPWLALALRRGDTSGGLLTVQDLAAGCVLLLFERRGVACGALALEIAGPVCWIRAAGGRGELAAEMLTVAKTMATAAGARRLGFTTRRRGLIKKMQRNGFAVSAVEMTMDI